MFETRASDLDSIRGESGLDLVTRIKSPSPFWAEIGVFRLRSEFADDDAQLAWLCDTANRLVSTIRPRLSVLAGVAA